MLYKKSVNSILADVSEFFLRNAVNVFGTNPFDNASIPRCRWQCGLKATGIALQNMQDRKLFITIENKVRGGI